MNRFVVMGCFSIADGLNKNYVGVRFCRMHEGSANRVMFYKIVLELFILGLEKIKVICITSNSNSELLGFWQRGSYNNYKRR